MTTEKIKTIGQRWVVYHYGTIKNHRPQNGEFVIFVDPDIQTEDKVFLSFVVGYGNKTVEELRGNVSFDMNLIQQNVEALAESFRRLKRQLWQLEAMPRTYIALDTGIPYVTLNGKHYSDSPYK